MLRRRSLAEPMCTTVLGSKDDSRFAKYPTTVGVGKHRPDQTRIDIGSVKEHPPPTETTVFSFQQVGARLVIRFQLEHIALGYQPTDFLVGKINVAEIVFGERMEPAPVLPAVD